MGPTLQLLDISVVSVGLRLLSSADKARLMSLGVVLEELCLAEESGSAKLTHWMAFEASNCQWAVKISL